jgi:hypothetical protein
MPLPPWMSREARNVERLAPIVALRDRDHFRRVVSLIFEVTQAQAGKESERDLGLHVDELLLDQLVGAGRSAKLLALERMIAPACQQNSGRERAPGDAMGAMSLAVRWLLKKHARGPRRGGRSMQP